MEARSEVTEQSTVHVVSFTGKASEYFGIWIVNLLLSIVTIGIYTAWAKVRRLRYFYGNTWLDGHNFEYHAKPIQILIGRVIVVVVLGLFNLLANFYPAAAGILIIPYFLAFPWLINRAFQFNARMSSYRNIRFGFTGTYLRALWVFIVLPLIVPVVFSLIGGAYLYQSGAFEGVSSWEDSMAVLILGILFVVAYALFIPIISKQTNAYIANGMKLGTADFEATIGLSELYKNLGVALMAFVGVLVSLALVGYIAYLSSSDAAKFGLSQIAVTLLYISIPVAYLAYAAGVRNIAFNATRIEGGHQLLSGVPRLGYAWVLISNFVVSVLSIGLMIPWAAIRTWRYLAHFTALESESGLSNFVADQEAEGNVIAAEYLDIDGIDFGL